MIDLPALREHQWHPLDGIVSFVSVIAAILYVPMTALSVVFALVCADFLMSDMWADALKALIYAVTPIAFLYGIRWLQAILIRIIAR